MYRCRIYKADRSISWELDKIPAAQKATLALIESGAMDGTYEAQTDLTGKMHVIQQVRLKYYNSDGGWKPFIYVIFMGEDDNNHAGGFTWGHTSNTFTETEWTGSGSVWNITPLCDGYEYDESGNLLRPINRRTAMITFVDTNTFIMDLHWVELSGTTGGPIVFRKVSPRVNLLTDNH